MAGRGGPAFGLPGAKAVPNDNPAPEPAQQTNPAFPGNQTGESTEGRTEMLNPSSRGHAPSVSQVEKTPVPTGRPPDTEATLCPPLPDGRLPSVAGYQLLGMLGGGSYGLVYKALELASGKTVAIKFFLRGADEKWQALLEEVRQHAKMDAVPGIVDLKTVVTSHDPPYYVMAYADQGSLADRLVGREPLPYREALRLFRQITTALAYVHVKGICHCDLKPGNVLLDTRGQALLADFGQAQPASKGHPALGTLYFMPPEQADPRNHLPDPTWDVYAAGAILYTSLVGKLPRYDETVHKELQAIPDIPARLAGYRSWLRQSPPPLAHRGVPGVDASLAGIIERCLDLNPHRRFRDANEILTALDARARLRRQRPLVVFGLAASFVLLLITALTGARSKNEAIARYERDLAGQLVDSNLSSASLIAGAVQRQLKFRIDRVTQTVSSEPTRTRLVNGIRNPDRAALESVLRLLMTDNEGRPRARFAETTVTNARGELLALMQLTQEQRPGEEPALNLTPIDPQLLRARYSQFSWRDWFSGLGDHFHDTSRQYPPIRHPHVSAPYASSLDETSLFISVSAPILEPQGQEGGVAGVLEAAIDMTEMNRWLRQAHITRGGFAVLFDRRRHCVLHQRAEHLPRMGEPARQFFTAEEFASLFPEPMGTLPRYRDPLDGREYLVGYAHVNDPRTNWVVLVQHDREKFLAPINDLSGRLSLIGWQSFLTVSLLVGGLWGWLYWTIRRMELPGEA